MSPRELSGDVGGRGRIRPHPDALREVAMPDPDAGQDVDTWEDYLAAEERLKSLFPRSPGSR